MNTQTQVHRLEAGQALALSRQGAGPVVLAEGEVLVQAPARWRAGTVVLSAPVRHVAPAALRLEPSSSVIALRPSSMVVREAAPLLSFATLRAAAAWLRGAVQAPAAVTAGPADPASGAAAARSIA